MIRLVLIWAMASIALAVLWAAACGPADLDDSWFDDEPDDRRSA